MAYQGKSLQSNTPEPVVDIMSPTARNELQHWACRLQRTAWQQWHEATKYRQAEELLRQADLSFTKYALQLSRADLRIFISLLTGHADLNRHLTLMQIQTDAVCPLNMGMKKHSTC